MSSAPRIRGCLQIAEREMSEEQTYYNTTIGLHIGPRLCRRPAAVARNLFQDVLFSGVLRLVGDDTAAVRWWCQDALAATRYHRNISQL